MKSHITAGLVLSLAACTVPDVSKELEAADELMVKTGKSLKTELQPVADKEVIDTEQINFAANLPVVTLVGDCDISAARSLGKARTDCVLEDLVDPGEDETNATAVLRAVTVLEGYFAALARLADSKTTDDIEKQTSKLIGALQQTGEIQAESFQRLSQAATDHGDAVVAVAGFAAGQLRTRKLRQVVRNADPLIGDMTSIVVGYIDEENPAINRASQNLAKANDAMDDAMIAGDAEAHRAAVVALRSAHKAFRKAEANSSAAGLLSLRQLHATLLRRLNGPGSVQEVDAVLKDIIEINELIQK